MSILFTGSEAERVVGHARGWKNGSSKSFGGGCQPDWLWLLCGVTGTERARSHMLAELQSSWGWTAPLGNLFWCSATLTVVSYVQIEFLVFGFLPIASCPVTGLHWEETGSMFFTPSHQIYVNIDENCLSLFRSRLNNPRSLSLFSCERCYNPVILVALCWTCSAKSMSFVSTGPSTPNVEEWVEQRIGIVIFWRYSMC